MVIHKYFIFYINFKINNHKFLFQGVNEAFVAKLFDPLLSPRNHAIIALKKN